MSLYSKHNAKKNVVRVPSKTPNLVVNKLNAACNEVLSRPDVVTKWRKAVELAGVPQQ